MRRLLALLYTVILGGVLGATVPALAVSLVFTTIDAPDATSTRARGINAAGQIVGSFTDGAGKVHGYLRAVDGTFTTIDAPGATGTIAYGINAAGQIVGDLTDARGKGHGYLRAVGGTFTTIDAPDAGPRPLPPGFMPAPTPPDLPGTSAYGINATGQIVGDFADYGLVDAKFLGTKIHGYLRTAEGIFTTIDVPGARHTSILGINPAGQIVGVFQDAGGKIHGYLRTTEGIFTTINAPDATETSTNGINAARQIVGDFTDAAGKVHGYLRATEGTFITIDAPGATRTFAEGINDPGQIVGSFMDAGGKSHGYLATTPTSSAIPTAPAPAAPARIPPSGYTGAPS